MRQATRNRHVLAGICGLTMVLIGPMTSRSDAQFVPGVGTYGTPFTPGVGTYGTPFTSGSYFGPSYGPFYGGIGTGGYTAGYGIGGLGGYGIGYGRYGGGYGGYGFGYSGFPYSYGYGFGGGYGGLGYNIGMTAADQAMMKYQNYALNAARYNFRNAQTTMAYQAALLYRQEAMNTLLENRMMLRGGPKPPPNPSNYSHASYGDTGGPNPEEQPKLIPLDQLIASDGEVLWPLGAPTDGELGSKREAADQAIRKVITQFAKGDRVPVRDIVAARNALSDYAVPAADKFEEGNKQDYEDFVHYVQSLDAGLRNLDRASAVANARQAPEAPAVPLNITSDDAPKTGGDALKKAVVDDKPAAPSPGDQSSTRPPATPSTNAAGTATPERPEAANPTTPSTNPTGSDQPQVPLPETQASPE